MPCTCIGFEGDSQGCSGEVMRTVQGTVAPVIRGEQAPPPIKVVETCFVDLFGL